jgi:hypothetical protein
MDAASVKLDSMEVTGDGDFTVSEDSPAVFQSRGWGITIDLRGLHDSGDCEFSLQSGAKLMIKA